MIQLWTELANILSSNSNAYFQNILCRQVGRISIFTMLILANSEKSKLVSGVFSFLAQHSFRFYEILSAENSVQYVLYRPACHLHLISIQNWNINNILQRGMQSTFTQYHSFQSSKCANDLHLGNNSKQS